MPNFDTSREGVLGTVKQHALSQTNIYLHVHVVISPNHSKKYQASVSMASLKRLSHLTG